MNYNSKHHRHDQPKHTPKNTIDEPKNSPAPISENQNFEPIMAQTQIKESPSITVPIAIIIAGIIVAGSILWTGSRTPSIPKVASPSDAALAQLKKGSISAEVNLNKKDFAACLASGKYTAPILVVSSAGEKAGITGTPFSILIAKNGKKYVINGAQPIASLKQLIESVLTGDPKGAVSIDIPEITSNDRITGNPSADIKIVEYSDTECPFSKMFHQTMIDIMKEYGASGKVAWVYRYFPLDSIHPKARLEAEATECANELGGNTKYWEYLDLLFKVTPSNNGLDSALL